MEEVKNGVPSSVRIDLQHQRSYPYAFAYGKKTHGLDGPKGFTQEMLAHAEFEHKLPPEWKPVARPQIAFENGLPPWRMMSRATFSCLISRNTTSCTYVSPQIR
jgi:hypothetical protein